MARVRPGWVQRGFPERQRLARPPAGVRRRGDSARPHRDARGTNAGGSDTMKKPALVASLLSRPSAAALAPAHARSEPTGQALVIDEAEAVERPVGMMHLALVFLYLGSVSIGGRSMAYLQDELVRRRGWMRLEDYLETFTLARILPGSSGLSNATLAVQMLRGSGAAALCIGPYVLPGALLALVLSVLMFNGERPAWLSGALHGI